MKNQWFTIPKFAISPSEVKSTALGARFTCHVYFGPTASRQTTNHGWNKLAWNASAVYQKSLIRYNHLVGKLVQAHVQPNRSFLGSISTAFVHDNSYDSYTTYIKSLQQYNTHPDVSCSTVFIRLIIKLWLLTPFSWKKGNILLNESAGNK